MKTFKLLPQILTVFLTSIIFFTGTSPALAQPAACIGQQKSMPVSSNMPYFKISVGGSEGMFLLDFGATSSSIDTNGFLNGNKPAHLPGEVNKFANFDFYGSWGTVQLHLNNFSHIQLPTFKQAGIIGTDFLSLNIFTLDYTSQMIYRSSQNTMCSDADLLAAGYKPVSTAGYFSNDLSKLNNKCTANIPTVPVKIGKATAVAQIDPGFDDKLYKYSVNINEAFFKAIKDAGVTLIATPQNNMNLSTCVQGITENITAYKLAPNQNFEITGTDGTPVMMTPEVHIFVKKENPALAPCGGIGTWRIPAAQFGASFLTKTKRIIFDPFAQKVWFYTR